MKNRSVIFGTFLIALGCLFLVTRYLFNIELFNFGPENFWPIIVIGVGLAFESAYFATGRNPGLLVPGGIISTIGALFLFEQWTNWRFAAYTWPVYIFAVAIGLFQLYLFYGRPKGLLIPILILTGIASLFTVMSVMQVLTRVVDLGVVIPAVLIITGIFLFLKAAIGRSHMKVE